MAGKTLLYEGKAKRVYKTDRDDQIIHEFKDDFPGIEGSKSRTIKHKGSIHNTVCTLLFEYLESFNIPTHFIKKTSDREMLVKKLEIIPVEVVMRNVAAQSLSERYHIEEGKELKYPMLEYYLKDDTLNDPLISESFVYAFGYATPDEMRHVSRLAFKANAVMKDYFERRHLKLVEFSLEFGRKDSRIYLADEITPETCLLWDMQENDRLDKNRFRLDQAHAEEAYQELFNRVVGG